MNDLLFYLILTSLMSIIIGFILGKFTFQSKYKSIDAMHATLNKQLAIDKDTLKNEIATLKSRLLQETTKREALLILNAKKDVNLIHLEQNIKTTLAESTRLQEQFSVQFENLANKIFEEKATKFTLQNKENIKQILTPLNERIQSFEKRIETAHKESIGYNTALYQQIIGLKDLNLKMSQDAINLTKALKGDNKVQGNWGELVLERVLEKSGLEKGREYVMEKSFAIKGNVNRRLRPDVIIYLPDNKRLIVDSKVSLKHYEQYINADNANEKEAQLKQHVLSLNRHVSQLSAKKYEDIYQIESPDFVLLFVPIEPAFAVALNADNQLYNKAFDKNIIMVTPTTLLATLRTIDSMWNNEKQQQNALEIAKQAGALYDKFESLVQDLTKIGKQMDTTKNVYSLAMNKLIVGRGNLISRVENLKKMGAKTKKSLPEDL